MLFAYFSFRVNPPFSIGLFESIMTKRRRKTNDNTIAKKRKVTPLFVPKKRTLPDAPKKRVRRKRENQTISSKEKEIISSFGRKFTPRSSLATGHKLGRNPAWVRQQQKTLITKKKNRAPFENTPFERFVESKRQNNKVLKKVSKGCQLLCNGTGEMVTCPTCNRFQFHLDCLHKILISLNMPTVDVAQK